MLRGGLHRGLAVCKGVPGLLWPSPLQGLRLLTPFPNPSTACFYTGASWDGDRMREHGATGASPTPVRARARRACWNKGRPPRQVTPGVWPGPGWRLPGGVSTPFAWGGAGGGAEGRGPHAGMWATRGWAPGPGKGPEPAATVLNAPGQGHLPTVSAAQTLE